MLTKPCVEIRTHNLEKGVMGHERNFNQDYEIPAMINSCSQKMFVGRLIVVQVITINAGDYTPWSALTPRTSYSHPQPGPASQLKLKT